jgi:hypothetical protein
MIMSMKTKGNIGNLNFDYKNMRVWGKSCLSPH